MNSKLHSPDAAVSALPCPAGPWRAAGMAPSGFVRRDGLPRFAADLERAEQEAKLFAEAYRGKIAHLAGQS